MAVVVIAIATSLALLGTHREPEYQGRSLSQWLAHTSVMQVFPVRTAAGLSNFTFTQIHLLHVPGARFSVLGTNTSFHLPPANQSESLREALRAMGDAATPT